MRIRIALVDDEKILRYRTAECLRGILPETDVEIREYEKAENLLMDIEEGNEFDVYFLDVEMPEMDGLELAGRIRRKDRQGYIVFLTSFEKYALQGYEVHAYAYVLKEKMQSTLPEILEKIRTEMRERWKKYYIIETASRFEKLAYEEILYIYKSDRNCIFVTEDGEHRERISLEEVYKRLDGQEFIYIDKGQITNIRNIVKIVKEMIYFPNGDKVAISRSNIKKVKLAVREYWRDRI